MRILLSLLVLFSSASALTTISDVGVEKQVGRTMTFQLESKMECLWEPLETGQIIRITVRSNFEENLPLQIRTTSPSGEFSDWQSGKAGSVGAEYNVTETGDYELCVHSARPARVSLTLFFYNPSEVDKAFQMWLEEHNLSKAVQELVSNIFQKVYQIKYSIRFYNSVTSRDEVMQETNSEHVRNYAVAFSIAGVAMACLQVYLVRGMFSVNEKRIRI